MINFFSTTLKNLKTVTLAAERDRLKDIKNEMTRRREFDSSEKNLMKQQQQQHTNQQNHVHSPLQLSSASGSIGQKEHILDSNFMHKKIDADKLMLNETQRTNNKESVDSQLYSPTNNWSNRQNVSSSTPSLRSSHGGGGCGGAGTQSEHPINKVNLVNCNQGKESSDSGAADMLNMSIEAASMQSCSSRGYSVPPPMRNIAGREGSFQFERFQIYDLIQKKTLI